MAMSFTFSDHKSQRLHAALDIVVVPVVTRLKSHQVARSFIGKSWRRRSRSSLQQLRGFFTNAKTGEHELALVIAEFP